MNKQENNQTFNVNGSSNISFDHISQTLSINEQTEMKDEIEALLKILSMPEDQKNKLIQKLQEAKIAVEKKEPKSQLAKIFEGAGSFLKDIAKEAGKTAITALIKSHTGI